MNNPEPTVLNINVPYLPVDEVKGVRVAEIGENAYDYYFEEEVDGERMLSLKGRSKMEFKEGTDRYFLERGYATLTPVVYGSADPEVMKRLTSWLDD